MQLAFQLMTKLHTNKSKMNHNTDSHLYLDNAGALWQQEINLGRLLLIKTSVGKEYNQIEYADLKSNLLKVPQHSEHDTQHNDIQPNDTLHNDIQHNDTQA